MAVPITVKMPDPITAPIPRAVSDSGPRVFFNRRSGSSESEISLSMDLQQKSWLPELSGSLDGLIGGACAKGLPCATGSLTRSGVCTDRNGGPGRAKDPPPHNLLYRFD